MSVFLQQLGEAAPTRSEVNQRRWLYIPYDRLTDRAGPLLETRPERCGIVMVESLEKGLRRPYHKKKLALLLSNERHFALEQAARGVKVIYIFTPKSFGDGLLQAQTNYALKQITVMRPAERELRLDLNRSKEQGLKLEEVEDSTWLTSEAEFDEVFNPDQGTRSFLMDRFYRAMRKRSGLLMQSGKPIGGKFSYDHENRKPFRGEVMVPQRPSYPPDAVTAEVLQLVAKQFPAHFGSLEGFDLPVTASDCREAWSFALTHLLPYFGPWEDAMVSRQPDLFHSKISALMNLSRVLPREAVEDVAAAYAGGKIPLASAEGFIRQVLGWREFMRHVHRRTDGYRDLQVPYEKAGKHDGAAPTALNATRPLPAVYWGVVSGLNCVDTVVGQVMREGWSHHITRLMVLSNLATLCGFSPRELTDWFWIAYVDAYDWVVESNVLGMATFSDGGVTATKPYVSGAAYINRMSDYCKDCIFDPKRSTGPGSCPFTALYWTFLERNSELLGSNQRLAMPYATLRKKTAGERKALRERADAAIEELERASQQEGKR